MKVIRWSANFDINSNLHGQEDAKKRVLRENVQKADESMNRSARSTETSAYARYLSRQG